MDPFHIMSVTSKGLVQNELCCEISPSRNNIERYSDYFDRCPAVNIVHINQNSINLNCQRAVLNIYCQSESPSYTGGATISRQSRRLGNFRFNRLQVVVLLIDISIPRRGNSGPTIYGLDLRERKVYLQRGKVSPINGSTNSINFVQIKQHGRANGRVFGLLNKIETIPNRLRYNLHYIYALFSFVSNQCSQDQ